MILNRLGNKDAIADQIYKFFPKHDLYIEPFFGAGGMYFNKPKAKHNFLNDKDEDVYNLFRLLIDRKDDLVAAIDTTPIIETQFKLWGKGQQETDPVMKAVRFLFISNFGLYGKPNTLRIGAVWPKRVILSHIDQTLEYIKDAYFFNTDFRDVFRKIDYKDKKDRTFCYCDPPYLGTDDNYSHSFAETDSNDLFDTLQASDIKWAMSEFDNEFILKQATNRGLIITEIGNRKNIMNTRKEILVTNYETFAQKSAFDL